MVGEVTKIIQLTSLLALHLPCSGKVWQGETLANLSIWPKKVWRMNSTANRLSIVTTNLDGFSLANHRRFAKFAKLSPRQTFLLYGTSNHHIIMHSQSIPFVVNVEVYITVQLTC